MRKYLFFAIIWVFFVPCDAQNVLIGSPTEDYLRRSQIMGKFDSSQSFSLRPLRLDPKDSVPDKYGYISTSLAKRKGLDMFLYPVVMETEFNSHHPYNWNNGAMVPGKGLQSIVSTGVHTKLSLLTISIRPEVHYSQNNTYEGFPDTLSDLTWSRRYIWWNRMDTPETFGTGSILRILPGQSRVSLDAFGMSIGLSTENLWWGPGKRNSLLMSNNSQSFPHLTFNSTKPVPIFLGTLEWQMIGARLVDTEYDPPFPARDEANQYYSRLPDDWRYLNGFVLAFSPKLISGLSIGTIRTVQSYSEQSFQKEFYLPALINLFRTNDNVNRNEAQIDQYIALNARYFNPSNHAEIYFEFGRNDASLHFRDFFLSPEHSRAYTFGFSKLFSTRKNSFVQLDFEMTQIQQSVNRVVRDAGSWYLHSRVRGGYTNKGEVLGAGIGPGSNFQGLELSWISGFSKHGIVIERLVHNNDFYYTAFSGSRDFRRFWVDFNLGIQGTFTHQSFQLKYKLIRTRALNYQWELHNDPTGNVYFVNGRDVTNWFAGISGTYVIKVK